MRALAVLAALLLAGQAFAATPEERYDAALKALSANCKDGCGFELDDSPSALTALDGLWDATQAWTIDFLASHPGVSEEKLNTELKRRHPDYANAIAPDNAARLGPELLVFAARWGETGNVFLAGRKNGHWIVVWDIRQADPGKFPQLKGWRSAAARWSCRQKKGAACGPLYGSVFALKPDREGRARFGVRATYAQMMGATVFGQISFWRWDGNRANPLLAASYPYMVDDDAVDHVPADAVVVRVKSSFQSFWACGACIGRQLDWRFRVLPDRIVDEGKEPVVPELDAVDALLERRLAHKTATDLASPVAITSLDRILAALGGDGLQMESDRAVKRTSSGADVCLATDSLPPTVFSLIKRGSGFFVSGVQALGRENCRQAAQK